MAEERNASSQCPEMQLPWSRVAAYFLQQALLRNLSFKAGNQTEMGSPTISGTMLGFFIAGYNK